MDWRNRKYYQVAFDHYAVDMRMNHIKGIRGCRIHPSKNDLGHLKDEYQSRSNGYHYVISVPDTCANTLEYELRKAKRNDLACKWKEILPAKNNKKVI